MITGGSERGPAGPVARVFATTHWTVVLTAVDATSPDVAAALEELYRAFWYPLYAYTRRLGRSPEDAQDLPKNSSRACWRRTGSLKRTRPGDDSVPS